MDAKKNANANSNQTSAASPQSAAGTPSVSPQSSPNLSATPKRFSFSSTHPTRRLSLDSKTIAIVPQPFLYQLGSGTKKGTHEPFAPRPKTP